MNRGPLLAVVGVVGGVAYGPEAHAAIADARVIVGSARHLNLINTGDATLIELAGPLDAVLDRVAAHHAAGRSCCVLASGDPGFFGIVRALGARFGADRLAVFPAPSSVALAFAAVGRSWDDAVVASAHGRALDPAINAVRCSSKAAVLTSPEHPPEVIGRALLAAGAGPFSVTVLSRIGEPNASMVQTDLAGLAAGHFDPMSVIVLLADGPESRVPATAWGLSESMFEYRDSMITKSEVRAVVLAKLALPRTGVLWDIGAGSGSVAIECARLAPAVRVIAIERDPAQVVRVHENARRHGVTVEVVEGTAPDALHGLADPDRVFIGGGGISALDGALERLRPSGVIVANFALLDRAVTAAHRLGSLVQVSVARGVPVGEMGLRLDAANPVFICWGPGND